MIDISPPAPLETDHDRNFVYYVVRYVPDLVRGEWINIGVLLFDPESNARRFRLMEDEEEFRRVRRTHPDVDQGVIRLLQENLESRFAAALIAGNSGESERIVSYWDTALSNTVQLSSARASQGPDLDSEIDRLYGDHVAVHRAVARTGVPGSRGNLRGYCSEVFRQARLWDRLEKRVPVAEFTFPGDPMRLDFSYRRNGTRGFVQTISVSHSPGDAKMLAYTAQRIHERARFASEFTAVTDLALSADNGRHRFVRETLRDAGIEPVARDGFAVWVAKLRSQLLSNPG
jgi:hypothetical protein